MRKFFTLFMIGIVAAMAWSCSDDDDDKPFYYDSLPATAKTFVETYFPGDNPVKVTRESGSKGETYEVTLKSGFEIEFNATGEWVDIDGPLAATLPNDGFVPESIRDYVAANYPFGINSISRDSNGYEVTLSDLVEIEFDANGNFIRVDN